MNAGGELIPRLTEREEAHSHITPQQIQQVRTSSPLGAVIQKKPEIETWIARPYSLHEIQNAIMRLENNKNTGTDGIPGEIYKATYKHLSHCIQELAKHRMRGQPLPDQWTEGAIIHLSKKETTPECNNYRPICLAQIIYKIWVKLLTTRLTQIMHLPTSSTQYGYKQGVSTSDAIVRIEHAIQTGPDNLAIAIMDLARAFGCVNRKLLWAALYKKGYPSQQSTI